VRGTLYVADTGNNLVLGFSRIATNAFAHVVLGQPDFGSRLPAASVNDLTLLAGPVALATDSTNLYVVDRDLARIVVYRGDGLAGKVPAAEALGGLGGPPDLRVSGGIVAQRGALFTSKLLGSDTLSSRVAVVQSVSRLVD
jgi:hypothetical protein